MSRLAREPKPEPVNDATAAVAALVAEVRNQDLDGAERVDAARLLARERDVKSVADLLALVRGSTGVLSSGAVDACADAWAKENGLP